MVVAELEAVGVEMRDRAHPLAVGQDHIHIAGPAVEVADQAPDIAVADGDRIVGRIEHDFPETCGNLDVRAAGHRLERLIQGHERSAEVGIPGTVETPLEFRSFRHGDIGRPEAAVVGGEDVVLPVTVQTDDVPTLDRLRLRTGFIAADDAGYLGTRGFGHLGKAGARIHEEVEDTVGTDHDVRAVLRDFEFSVKAAEGTAHVHGPGFVLTELELVACGKGDAECHVPVAVGNHGQVAVPADAVLRQGADDRPVACFLEIGERIVSFADPCGSGLRIDEQVVVAVGTDDDVRTVLRYLEGRVETAEGTAHVHGPGLVLTELEFIAGTQLYVGGDMISGTVGPHFEILVPAYLVSRQGADDRPVAGLRVLDVRAALRKGHHEIGNGNLFL